MARKAAKMFKLLYCSSTSACFELQNTAPFYAPEKFMLKLNGVEAGTFDSNVFSVYSLTPDTEYTAEVGEDKLTFRTKTETAAISVKDFGAVGDGVTEDTVAIQTAINFMPTGGRLYFPEGTYLTLPLALKSHITIELSEKAVILGSTDRSRYPVIPGKALDIVTGEDREFGIFEGQVMDMYQALFHAEYCEDITVIGPGTLDGNAQNGDWWEIYKTVKIARPRVLFTNRCKNIRFHGVQVRNSAAWQIHPFFSDDLGFYDVSVSAPKISPNTDALDPESCDRVEIIGCRFSVGDDCVAIKSGKIDLGKKYKKPADHTTIRNCLMAYGHGSVVIGSEIGAGINNLSVTQCYFKATDRGLRIKTRRGRGEDCRITGIVFDNIIMEDVLTPIVVNSWYNCCDVDRFSEYNFTRKALPVDYRTPHLGTFAFRNMKCTGAEVAACYVDGLPEAPIEEVAFENVSISFNPDAKPGECAMECFLGYMKKVGLHLENVERVILRNVDIEGVEGDGLIAVGTGSIVEENFNVR